MIESNEVKNTDKRSLHATRELLPSRLEGIRYRLLLFWYWILEVNQTIPYSIFRYRKPLKRHCLIFFQGIWQCPSHTCIIQRNIWVHAMMKTQKILSKSRKLRSKQLEPKPLHIWKLNVSCQDAREINQVKFERFFYQMTHCSVDQQSKMMRAHMPSTQWTVSLLAYCSRRGIRREPAFDSSHSACSKIQTSSRYDGVIKWAHLLTFRLNVLETWPKVEEFGEDLIFARHQHFGKWYLFNLTK